MKNLIYWILLINMACVVTLLQSCKEDTIVIVQANLCDDIVCYNGGTCDNGECECPEGFSGSSCLIEDPCYNTTCQNGGDCSNGECQCPLGFEGIACEIDNLQELLDGGMTPIDLCNNNNEAIPAFYGKFYQGGVIFHLDLISGTGLIASLNPIATEVEWGCEGIVINGADGEEIGTGWQNTLDILEGCSQSNIAAKKCSAYSSSGQDNWFLPSLDELLLIRNNLHKQGYVGFDDGAYWTSSEVQDDDGNSVAFKVVLGGFLPYIADLKEERHNVIAIHSF